MKDANLLKTFTSPPTLLTTQSRFLGSLANYAACDFVDLLAPPPITVGKIKYQAINF